MTHSLHELFRHFWTLAAPSVGPQTQVAWPREHRLPADEQRARARFALSLLTSLIVLLCPTWALAQEFAGPVMQVTSTAGASSQLPLVNESLSVVIDQGHASTDFRHTFQNETGTVLEGRYTISLGTVATATGFSYWNGEERIVGEIFEKEAAARVYEAVAGTGRDPGLLEQTGEGQFAFRVAPITAGEKKRVQVTTAEWLRQTEDTIEYQAPLGRSGKGSVVSLRDSRTIEKVWSPTHKLSIDVSGTTRKIRLGDPLGADKKFILRYRVSEAPFSLSTAVHRTKGHDAYAVVSISTPKGLKKTNAARDVTLVIDRSGSMTGAPLEAARRATIGVLRRLDKRDFVNVVTFDDGTDALFGEPRRVEDTRQEAIEFVEAMQAGGGTDLALALNDALARQKKSGRSQVVLFLTDGQSNSQQALEAASKAPSAVRLYTVGIGAGVDRPLLSRLARENRGRFTFVADESNLERDVDHLFSRIESPALSDLKLELDGAELRRIYPRRAPDLFGKDQLTFAMRMRPGTSAPTATLRVSAKQDGKTRIFEKKVSLAPVHRPWVGRMWGQNRVDDLLEQISLNGETPELKRETIELALAYSLVTRFTSFLAIPESEINDAVRGTMEEERARRARIMNKHKDAAALSRTLMPPGDPVITVRAPQSALGVTAVFPFGLTLDLSYEPKSEVWEGRFLVPNHVPDGPYDVDIFVADRDGNVTTTTTSYEIDSRAPGFETGVTQELGGIRLAVDADESLREVRVVAVNQKRAALRIRGVSCGPDGCNLEKKSDTRFLGALELAPGTHKLRVIVTDTARNESVRFIEVVVPEHGEDC